MTDLLSATFRKTTVRGVIAMSLTAVGCFLAVNGTITGEAFMVQLATVIGFFFGGERAG